MLRSIACVAAYTATAGVLLRVTFFQGLKSCFLLCACAHKYLCVGTSTYTEHLCAHECTQSAYVCMSVYKVCTCIRTCTRCVRAYANVHKWVRARGVRCRSLPAPYVTVSLTVYVAVLASPGSGFKPPMTWARAAGANQVKR